MTYNVLMGTLNPTHSLAIAFICDVQYGTVNLYGRKQATMH